LGVFVVSFLGNLLIQRRPAILAFFVSKSGKTEISTASETISLNPLNSDGSNKLNLYF
jgi:hypothetical protein